MSHTIQRISNFELKIEGKDYYTTDLKLVLMPSAIPSFTATIASSDKPGLYDIDKAYETLKELNGLIYSNNVSLAVTIETPGQKETEELNLKDWVLVSVDESIGTSGTLTITAAHPAIYLALMGGFMNVTSKVTSHFKSASVFGAKDIIDIYQKVLDQIKKAPVEKNSNSKSVTASDGQNIETINNAIKEAVSRHLSEHKISSLLKWDPSVIEGGSKYKAFPNVKGMSNKAEKAIKRALFDYPLSINNVDIFSNFINICCASLGISILPHYWEQTLPVAPLSYWAKSSIDIDVSNTFSLDLNLYDYTPIFGTRILAQGTTAATMSAYYNASKEKTKETSYQIAYVPKHSKVDLAGKFVTFSSPNWFDSMLIYFSSAYGISGFDIRNYNNGKSVSSAKNKNLPGTEKLLLRVAEQIFYTLYRSRTQVRFSTRFMTNSDNKRIVPGQVITLKDNGKTVVTGYCNQVIIVLSPNEKAAYTSVSLSHVRTPDGNYLIKDGTLNPLYIES